jgi:carboxypeptidase family protein/TonB-dependent receptor-like protein
MKSSKLRKTSAALLSRWNRLLSAILPTALLAVGAAFGQTTTATLSGVVQDSSGSVLPGVRISVRKIGTGATRETATDSAGRYSLTNLEPGQYELRATAPGFKTAAQGVALSVGGATAMDLTLSVGEVSEVVDIKQEEPLIETTRAEVSRVIEVRQIDSLPNIGRNFVDFVKLSAFVAPGRENIGGGSFKEPDTGVGQAAAPRLAFGGQKEMHTMILVDGADNVQTFTGLPRATPSQEAAQEFRILNSTYLAEYGRALGGFVNIVTRSGANKPGGSIYYFGMNDALNVRPMLTGPSYALRQNQYGATFGGPIKKDKTFFFGNYEGQRRAESNKFSKVILDNLGPADGSQPNTINEVKRFYRLTPETPDLLRSNDYDGFLAKLDHRLANSNSLFGRYNLLDSTTHGFLGGGGRASPASSTARNNFLLDQSLVVSDIALLGADKVNEARVQWARRTFDFPSALKEPDLEVSNLLLTGKSTSDPDFYRESRLQVTDNFSYARASHALKFGADFNSISDTTEWDLFFPARVIFTNLGGAGPTFFNHTPVVFWWPLPTGTVQGAPTPVPFTQAVPAQYQPLTVIRFDHNAYGFFGQDEWKATSKLTLTYGLRYDFETHPDEIVLREDFNNFQPRLGLAYALSQRTVVRAGFGIFSDRVASSGIGQLIGPTIFNSTGYLPNSQVLYPGIPPVRGRFINPTVRGPVLAPLATLTFTTTGQVPATPTVGGVINPGLNGIVSGNLRTPYAEQASVEISREIGGGVAVSARYLYVHALKLLAPTGMLNGRQTGTQPSGKPILGARRFLELGDFFVFDNGGYSIFNGGSFELQKRFARGFSFHSSYTYSQTISNTESVAAVNDFPENPDRNLERALSRQHARHRYTLAFVSQIPASVPVLGDFRFSSILTTQSGRFFTVFAGSDANGDGNPTSDRPGALGRNTLEGPGFVSFDLRVAREFRISERIRAEFTCDFFNLPNRVNITDLNTLYGGTDLSLPPNPILGFGTPRDVANPRQIQYGVKLKF